MDIDTGISAFIPFVQGKNGMGTIFWPDFSDRENTRKGWIWVLCFAKVSESLLFGLWARPALCNLWPHQNIKIP
jgi:hypothetical protein